MTIWNYIFDSEYKQRSDIEALRSSMVEIDAAWSIGLKKAMSGVRTKLYRQELVLEGLITFLEGKGLLDRGELVKIISQIDLEDGIEDGMLGKDRTKQAPKCPFCEKPFNPKRNACVYCGEEVREEDLALSQDPKVKYVRCVKCFRRIPKFESRFDPQGPICKRCT